MKQHEDDSLGTSLPNVVPMVEIFAFLLFVTMGTAAAQQQELATRLARVKAATVSDRPSPKMFVQISGAGTYRVQGRDLSLVEMEKQMRDTAAATRVIVEPVPETAWQSVADVLSAARAARRDAVVRVTQQQEAKP
jgi:biopolymer transport protein ExbD